jgi:hypothetical protein
MITTCPLCKELNFGRRRYCKSCGHESYKSRLGCRCPYCSVQKQLDSPTPHAKPNSIDSPYARPAIAQ